jgi:hypothetical protein
MANNLRGSLDWRQGVAQLLQIIKPQRRGRIVLSPEVGEGRARFSRIRVDGTRQTQPQPVLTCKHRADVSIASQVILLDPCEEGGRRRHMRNLSGEFERGVENALARPAGQNLAGPAIEGKYAGSERKTLAINEIDPIAMCGRGNGFDVGRGSTARRDGLGDRLGSRKPKAQHVAFDPAGPWHRLRNAASRDRQLRSINVEDDCLADSQPIINSEQTRHGFSRINDVQKAEQPLMWSLLRGQ